MWLQVLPAGGRCEETGLYIAVAAAVVVSPSITEVVSMPLPAGHVQIWAHPGVVARCSADA